jgi:hypothetical protein
MPKCKGYTDTTGCTKIIGVAPYDRSALYSSTDAQYQLNTSRDHEREIAPIQRGDFWMLNLGTSGVNPRDPISPTVTGFQTYIPGNENMEKAGFALQKIAASKGGFVRIAAGNT